MKKRKGFVSNSSSTSFCLYGCNIDEDKIKKTISKYGLITEYPIEYGDGIYIGAEPQSIRDDETGAEFKARIQKAIKKVTGKEYECDWVTQGGYDG